MSVVQELRRDIRDFIQHPRRLNPLLKDKPNWNMLASSFDTVADTEMVIETYEVMADPQETGLRYLITYGILQALYVQQDAVESMVRAFEPNADPVYKIETESEAAEIRTVRNNAIGHPTIEGNAKSKRKPGVQMSHAIVQHSIHKDGFNLMTSFADGNHRFAEVSIPALIKKNRTMVERVLRRIKEKLEAAEMEHRNTFRSEVLSDIFPETLDYYFEKVFVGVESPGSPAGQWGGIHLKTIAQKVQAFRTALQNRGLLNSSTDYESDLAEVEYPLGELQSYWSGEGSLKDPRAAHVFAYFVRDKVRVLKRAAEELDNEYNEEIGRPPEEVK